MPFTTQTIGLILGWLLAGGAMLEALRFAMRAWRRRAQSERQYRQQRTDFCRRIEATARAARATKAIPDWQGWRQFRVAAIVDEALHVKSFYLAAVDGRPLSRFAPGQYLTFRLPLPESDEPVVRCYSLSASPREDFYRCTIKRVAPPADQPELPPGRGSSFFHECVEVGDVLEARAPSGTFLIDPHAAEPIVLIGAGIGVTPLVSMLDAIVRCGRRRDVYALFGFRNSRDHPFKDHLEKLASEHPNIQLHTSYTSPLAADVLYKDYNHRGRMTIERVRELLPSNNFSFYVCGPGQMMETLVPALWEWGVPETHVHYEAFGPASVKRVSRTSTAREPAISCEVRFERTGREVIWDGSFTSLLEFGEASGITLYSGCRAGSCGECMTAIRSGAIATLKTPGVTVPDGYCLTCISIPTGPLVLEA